MSESDKPAEDSEPDENHRTTGLRLHNNVSGLRHVPSLSRENDKLILSLERLSSGLKVNRGDSGDDPPQLEYIDKLV